MADQIQRIVSEVVVIDSSSAQLDEIAVAWNSVAESLGRGVPPATAISSAISGLDVELNSARAYGTSFALTTEGMITVLGALAGVTQEQIVGMRALAGEESALDTTTRNLDASFRSSAVTVGEMDGFYAEYEQRIRGVTEATTELTAKQEQKERQEISDALALELETQETDAEWAALIRLMDATDEAGTGKIRLTGVEREEIAASQNLRQELAADEAQYLATAEAAATLEKAQLDAALAVQAEAVADDAEIAMLGQLTIAQGGEAQWSERLTTLDVAQANALKLLTEELAADMEGLVAWGAAQQAAADTAAAAAAKASAANTDLSSTYVQRALATGVTTKAELDELTAAGIDTEAFARLRLEQQGMIGALVANSAGLAQNTEELAANTVAADANVNAHARLHVGMVSMSENLGPMSLGILAVGAAFAYAAMQATQWETELNQLQNNTSITTQQVQEMGSGILETSKQTGAGLEDLANASRHILDYSYSASDSLKILNEASRAAVATGAQTETVAQGVAQALHQYGASADEAANYTNELLRSSQLANTTLQQFSDQTKTAVGFSAAIGNSYQDTTAALSALTRVYGDASKASAGLDDILRYMLKPTQTESAAWDDLAKRSDNANLSAANLATTLGNQGLNGVINQVSAAYQKMGLNEQQAAQETLTLLNGQRGGIALYALLNSGLGDYNSALAENNRIIGGQLDPTTKAFNNTLDTAQSKWDRAGASLHALTAEGSALATVWGGLADAISNVANGFDALSQVGKQFQMVEEGIGRAIKSGDFSELGLALTGTTQQVRDFTLYQADLNTVLDAGGERAVSAAMAQGQLASAVAAGGQAAKGAAVDIQGLADQQAQMKDEAKSATTAYAEGMKDGFGTAISNTKQQMTELQQAIDQAKQFQAAALAAGESHKAELWGQFIDEKSKVQGELNDELTILNAFSTAAGQAGYDAGHAWSTNYEAQIASGMDKSLQPGFAPGSRNYTGGAAGMTPFQLPGVGTAPQPGPIAAAQVPASTMQLNADAAALEAIDKKAAAHDRSAAAAGREAATDARSAQTAENALTTAQQKYELDSRQLTLTENLTNAKNAETAAQKVLTDGDKEYNAALQQLTDGQEANAVAKRDDVALNEAIATAANTQASAATVAAQDAKAANDLTVSIHQTTDQLAELDREAQIAMKPLKDTLEADTAAMQALDKATADQDLIYQRQKEGIAELQYQEGLQEKQIMGPYITAYNASAAAVAAAQENVQKISDSYDQRLIPLTDKLTELEKEKANIQRQDVLGNEAQSVANLGAQLKNLVPGSAAYNEVLKQQAEAQKNLGLDVQIDKLTKQKDAIEAQKTKALEAANLQLKAAQEQEKASKIAMDAEQKIFDQQKQGYADQAALIDHNQTIYDEQQRDKKVAQQATIDADNAAIVSQQKVSDARAASDKAYLTELNNEQGEQSFTASQHSYVWGLAVTAANQAVKDLEAPYNTEDTRLKNLAQDVRDEKTAFDETKQPIVDNLKDQQTAAQSLLDVFKDAKSNVELASKWADAQAKFAIAMAGVNDSGPPASAAISDLAKAQGLADTNGTAAAKALNDPTTGLVPALNATTTAINTGVAPATANLATTTDTNLGMVGQTWNKYFGLPSSPGYDASVNIAWYMNNHNPDGFYSKLITWADIGLGTQGLRGMFDDRFVEMSTDVVGRATDMGNSIMGGIGSGVSTDTAVKGLSDAITSAVEKAMGMAQTNLGMKSPSTVAAERLGLPFGLGIAMGVDQSAAAVTSSVRGLFDSSGGSSARYTGASVGAGVGSVVINMDGMHTHLHFPNVSKPPENANEYTAAAADAISYAVQRRMKQRGLHNEIF